MKKYLVGGAVRDSLLQLPIKEKDWVVVGTTPQEMLKIGYEQVGKNFPVFLHPISHEEHALARTEKKTGHGYTGFICNASPKITLKEDLYRRDLTINAIARDKYGNIIDPYNGQRDMKLRILRHVSVLFKEDPLRVLRVARFAAKLFHMHFCIATDTLKLMKEMSPELLFLPPERIWTETKKALMTKNPEVYFLVLQKCHALKILFPEINKLFCIPSSKTYSNIDTGTHTMMALKASGKLSNDITVRFATLCHDIGKGETPRNQWPYHNKHEEIGTKIIENLCRRFKIENHLCAFSKQIAKYHTLLQNIENIPPKTIINLFHSFNLWRQPKKLEQIILTIKANIQGYNNKQQFPQEYFLHQAFLITKSVCVTKIIQDGYEKTAIKQELSLRREHALYHWKILPKKTYKSK
ncbi:multifunctional CCA addition/repair protein [Blochmannia endosymbiont of Polyrhachis (Hedomyrma) turneri]|uniref:multifunctional CCA addition/repair protein n=1 Tax=Blochmannia endosymbiont of Polyrhachis (Hedomyrma) turneri TaxID=1505596 RepID=UPI00061A6E1D|nr:multifunctional CCA addition/repair protein [Blochmannia endosymbiont of Polyrhachis (Hedomyrma) turneri]AKC59653.1 Multifunctional CCA protein [Blochmannia endosymbiont of Polyrhachis (Hedomyrma) turneri]